MWKINTIQRRLQISALFLSAFSLIALAGCGPEAPGNSTITVTAFGEPEIADPVSVPSVTAITTKTQSYRVSVADSDGNALNGIDVNFMGQFTNGQGIVFGSATGTVIGSLPLTLSTSQKTDNYGFLYFKVSAPYYGIGVQLSYPMNQTITPSATGGNLADDNYFYQITSLDYAGESLAGGTIMATVSNVTTTTATGSVALSWKRVPGATSYNVYGSSSIIFPGAPGYLVTIICPCPDPVTYTDQGGYFPQGAAPPSTNTTGLGLNSVKGTAQATSGTALSTFTIDF